MNCDVFPDDPLVDLLFRAGFVYKLHSSLRRGDLMAFLHLSNRPNDPPFSLIISDSGWWNYREPGRLWLNVHPVTTEQQMYAHLHGTRAGVHLNHYKLNLLSKVLNS